MKNFKDFKDFNLDAKELFSGFFIKPEILYENYTPQTEDEYDVWYFIIKSYTAFFLIDIANPDGGNNGLQKFTVRHLQSFNKEFFQIDPAEYTLCCSSTCELYVDNTSDMNEYL